MHVSFIKCESYNIARTTATITTIALAVDDDGDGFLQPAKR